MFTGGFYKLALSDFETISESMSSAGGGAMQAMHPSEMAICTEKSPKDG